MSSLGNKQLYPTGCKQHWKDIFFLIVLANKIQRDKKEMQVLQPIRQVISIDRGDKGFRLRLVIPLQGKYSKRAFRSKLKDDKGKQVIKEDTFAFYCPLRDIC